MADISSIFAPSQAYYEEIALEAQDYGETQLQKKQDEITAKQGYSSGSSTIVYVIMGIAAVGLIGFAILKKTGKI
jgi:hypothetical protein